MVSVSATAVAVVLALDRHNRSPPSSLAAEARTDPLTGLLNRRGLAERAELVMAHCKREGRPLALATFDIDYFKRINDEWGHEAGDRVLDFLGNLLWRSLGRSTSWPGSFAERGLGPRRSQACRSRLAGS
jgi:GGDEF domain-containing protein